MKVKLVVLTEIVSPYRIPVFNALAAREDIELHVIFLAETDPTQREWKVYKEEIKFSYQVLPSWRRRYRGRNILLNRGLGAALSRVKPDVVLCGGYNYLASWQALAWARKHRVPFLAWIESTSRDARNNHRWVELFKKRFISRCDAFVVPGKSSTEYVRSFNIPPSNIFVAPNAVDSAFFFQKSAEARAEGRLYREKLGLPERFFLYVGRLVEDKGVFDLLTAYGQLPRAVQEGIGMVFVGNGPAQRELMCKAAELQCGLIKFAGFVQREELPFYYGLAEACLLPTHSDTWGLVVNEAMACGLPIIITDVAGCMADLVEDQWNGLVVPSGRPSRLTVAMQRIAASPDGCLMGQRSQKRITEYSPESCAAGIAQAAMARKDFHV